MMLEIIVTIQRVPNRLTEFIQTVPARNIEPHRLNFGEFRFPVFINSLRWLTGIPVKSRTRKFLQNSHNMYS